MKRLKVLSLLMIAVMTISLFSGCGCSKKEEDPVLNAQSYDFTTTDVSYDMESDVNYINNIVLIFFKDEPSDDRKKEVAQLAGGTLVGEDQNVDQIQLRIKSRSLNELKQLCERLEKEDDVYYATYDVATKIEKGPQSGSKKEKTKKSGKVQQSDEMKIGIVDAGFDADHEDLNITVLNADVANKDDHGTHVAGIIGATNNNGIGIDGVVTDAKMLGYDWEPDSGQEWDTSTEILTGLTTCVKNGAKIVNFSLGLSDYDLPNDTKKKSKAVLDSTAEMASIYMSKLLEKGYDFAVVQSAGNGAQNGYGIDAVNNGFFCSVNNSNCKTTGDVTKEDIINRIIVVAAAYRPNKNGKVYLTDFSNAGSRVDVAAPGYDVYSCVCNNKYEKMSGTSMAAPMVAGYLAVEWEKDDSLTGDKLKGLFTSLPKKAYDNPYSKHTSGDFPFVDLWYKFKDPNAKAVTTKAPTTKPLTTAFNDDGLVKESGFYETLVESGEPEYDGPYMKAYELDGDYLTTYGSFDFGKQDIGNKRMSIKKRTFKISSDCTFYDGFGTPGGEHKITRERAVEQLDIIEYAEHDTATVCILSVIDGEVIEIRFGQA